MIPVPSTAMRMARGQTTVQRCPDRDSAFRRPSVMGVVNVTPDSFSDGGVNFAAEDARRARRGGCSRRARRSSTSAASRPGRARRASRSTRSSAASCPCSRRSPASPVSIDTSKAEVARRALALGAELVNDVTALRGDPELAGVVADAGAYLCLMHMQGEPRTMQVEPRYDDVASEVAAFLEERLRVRGRRPGSRRSGSASTRVSASARRSSTTSSSCAGSTSCSRSAGPSSIGFSRKSSLGRLLGDPDATTGSVAASVAAAVAAYERGATILRVHDVRETVEALTVAGGDPVIVELHGLEVFGHHGVLAEEQRDGQTFLFDVELEVDEPAADRIEDAVDYRQVAARVQEVSDSGRVRL